MKNLTFINIKGDSMETTVHYNDLVVPDSKRLDQLLTNFFEERKLLDILRKDDIIRVNCAPIDEFFSKCEGHREAPCLIILDIVYSTHHTPFVEKIIEVTDTRCVDEMRELG